MSALRLRAWVAGIWGGGLLVIALVAAPSLFAMLERSQAGMVAGRIFQIEAYASVALSVILILLERSIARDAAMAGRGSRFSVELALVLGALLCTVAGYFALQPMMQAARTGQQTALSFGALHRMSTLFFALKCIVVLVLAWRSSPR